VSFCVTKGYVCGDRCYGSLWRAQCHSNRTVLLMKSWAGGSSDLGEFILIANPMNGHPNPPDLNAFATVPPEILDKVLEYIDGRRTLVACVLVVINLT